MYNIIDDFVQFHWDSVQNTTNTSVFYFENDITI